MASGSSSTAMLGVTRMQLFELLSDNKVLAKANTENTKKMMLNYVMSRIQGLSETETMKKITSKFSTKILPLWKKSGRNKAYFLSRNAKWLNEEIYHSTTVQRSVTATPVRPTAANPSLHVDFATSSIATKKRRTKMLVAKHSPEKLVFAAHSSLAKHGRRSVATVIKKAAVSSPRSLRAIKKIKARPNLIRPYTAPEALALIINSKLTVSQYRQIRREAKERNCDIYPSYEKILNARKECYPEEITVTESMGEVKLQSLLDHSVRRLSMVQSEVISRVVKGNNDTMLEMKYKWGFDGSASHSTYKQKFTEGSDSTDSDMLLTAIVPLQLTAINENTQQIVWSNPRSSSTRFCLPIRIQFIKESEDTIEKENAYIECQINALTPTIINVEGQVLNVHHVLMKTMMDGKVANALAGNKSSQSCYICKATPNQMNNIDAILKRPCNMNTFGYGLSTLHAYIRLFECILHVSYRLNVKTWRVYANDKAGVEQKKREVIEQFRTKTGLLVDVVKQGSGNTNDGNTARRFFKETGVASEITGVDESLIKRFSIILQAITCGYKLQTDTFRQYALDTARLFVSLYPWYKMPASVHKLLIHGADVMDSLLLPIGQLSEEALEARHKECRYYREHNTRKTGRKQNMEDLLHALLISSDLFISNIRPLPKRKMNTMDQEVLNLVEVPQAPLQTQFIDDDSSVDEF